MPSLFRLFSSAVQTIMQPYGKLSPESRAEFQGFLHRAFGENKLRLTDRRTTLTVRVNTFSCYPEANTRLSNFMKDLKSEGMIDCKINTEVDTVKYGEKYGELIYFFTVDITAVNPTLLENTAASIPRK